MKPKWRGKRHSVLDSTAPSRCILRARMLAPENHKRTMVRPTQFVFLGFSLLVIVVRGLCAEPTKALVEAALEARSIPAASTMFTQMSAEQTGIITENRYDDPKMWDEHYQQISMGETGTGIAI